jgi:hypothetical protein
MMLLRPSRSSASQAEYNDFTPPPIQGGAKTTLAGAGRGEVEVTRYFNINGGSNAQPYAGAESYQRPKIGQPEEAPGRMGQRNRPEIFGPHHHGLPPLDFRAMLFALS